MCVNFPHIGMALRAMHVNDARPLPTSECK